MYLLSDLDKKPYYIDVDKAAASVHSSNHPVAIIGIPKMLPLLFLGTKKKKNSTHKNAQCDSM